MSVQKNMVFPEATVKTNVRKLPAETSEIYYQVLRKDCLAVISQCIVYNDRNKPIQSFLIQYRQRIADASHHATANNIYLSQDDRLGQA
ncbi:hypothetical protein MFLAVUS_007658 [Mucor flavus]|uniref:Uncharacterized protein n=1 Tax=Mucor flavus TaxID=439312 RepID=A0ABP9Z4X6_9FUNG